MNGLPFKAYQGDEPYIFISYAHKDSERVFSVIRQIHDAGYRIWYDEGIDPGSEWPEEIARHLTNASAVLLFVSPSSVESHNVRREVTFCINLRKLMVSVYLEPTEMSAGMILQLGLNQAVHYYTYKTDAEFFGKLLPSLPEKMREQSRASAAPAPLPPQPRPAALQMPDRLEAQAAQPAPTASHLEATFDPKGMVLPFLPKGVATVTLKNGGEASCPLNCFVTPQRNGNYDCLCLNKALSGKEQYFFGTRRDGYRFEDMASVEVSEGSVGLNLLIYLANGERRFFENVDPFEVGGLFGRSFRRYSMRDISKITFDPNGVTDIASDLALVTTKSGISFYTPIGMMETIQFSVERGIFPRYIRSTGFQLKETLIEYRKLTALELDIKVGGMYSDSDIFARYTTRSGVSEAVEFKQHYLPSLSGVNQYGCFHMSFAQVARIDIYAGGREGAPAPTPLPDITWPQPQAQVIPFFPDGLAKITDAAGTVYECPANAVLGVEGYGTWQAYDSINMNIPGERFSQLFNVPSRTSLEELESMELAHAGIGSADNYTIRMRDAAGVTLEGVYSHASDNAAPALVFAHGGEKGAVRVLALKSLHFDRDADAPDVEQAAVYTKSGRAIGMPRGSVVFSGGGANSYPGCCFALPTGNAVDIGTLRRMMIHDQQTDGGAQRWLVFECDGLRGAFPLSAELLKNYQLYGASELGLCDLKAGEDWYLLDMKR